MENHAIFTDTAADLPIRFLTRHQIQEIAMPYTLNGKDRSFSLPVPDRERVCDEFYNALRHMEGATTFAIAPPAYIDAFTPVLEARQDILYCFRSRPCCAWIRSEYESLTEGHPDKVCDQISDAVLDDIIAADPTAQVACETFTTTGMVTVTGKITTSHYTDIPAIARKTIGRFS